MRITHSSLVRPLEIRNNEYSYNYTDLEVFCMHHGDVCDSPKYLYGREERTRKWLRSIQRDQPGAALWLYLDTEPYEDGDGEVQWGVRPKQGPTSNEYGEIAP